MKILGPVALVGAEGPVPLGGALPHGFLAVVALESPRPVSLDRLASLLWGDAPPAGVKAALQQLATRVRRSLAAAGLADALRAVPPGYALDVDPAVIDVRAFRAAVRSGAESMRIGEYDAAASWLSNGLDLWAGAALADLVDLPLATVLAPGLDDERWRAEELRSEALLAAGRASESADLLSAATAVAPLRERLWVLQARALIAAGRPADAVRCARIGAAVITAECGVPPGPDLASVEETVRSMPSKSTSANTGPGRVALLPAATAAATASNGLLGNALRRAMDNAEQAAKAASARRNHGDAVRQWERALELLDAVDPNDDPHRLRLLLGLGEAHNTASVDAQARRVFASASEVARRIGDGSGLAWAALGFCGDRIGFTRPTDQEGMLAEALEQIGPGEFLLRGRLLARMATQEYWTGSIDLTLDLAERAMRAAVAAGDDEGRLLARYAMAFGCWTPDRTPRLVAVCEDYLEDARVVGDHRHELLAHRWLVPAVTELGDVGRGGREAQAAMEMADEIGISEQQWVSRVIAASHQLVAGDLVRAEALATEALALGSVSEPETALDFVSLFIWTLRWLQGRLGEIAALVEEVASTSGVDLARRLGLALTHGELGRPADARAILDRVSAADVDALQKDASWYVAMAAMAEAAASSGHREAAVIAFERLRPYHERVAITSVTATGPVAHHIGIAAWAAGHHELALRVLADAIEIADRIGAPVFGARSRLALAERLVTVGRTEQAVPLARAAHVVAVECGLCGVERRAANLVRDT